MDAVYLKQMYELEDSYWWFVARRRLVRSLIGRYAGSSPLKILDAGAGTGALMSSLTDLGEVWGCDVSPEALAFCRQRGIGNLVQCSVERLDFPDNAFDVLTSCDVIEHVEDDNQALREFHRVLRPGGVAVLTVPALRCLWSPHDEVLSHLRRYHRKPLRRMLRAAGFEELKLTYVTSFLLPLMMIHRLWIRCVGASARKTGITPLPYGIDRLFLAIQELEAFFVHTSGLPWGASLVAVVRKP